MVIESGASETPIVGTAEVDADAPHSEPNRGFFVPQVIHVQGLADQTAADNAAMVAEAQDPDAFEYVLFDTVPNPEHDTFDVISYAGNNYREEAWSLPLRDGSPMAHSLRRIYSA